MKLVGDVLQVRLSLVLAGNNGGHLGGKHFHITVKQYVKICFENILGDKYEML